MIVRLHSQYKNHISGEIIEMQQQEYEENGKDFCVKIKDDIPEIKQKKIKGGKNVRTL